MYARYPVRLNFRLREPYKTMLAEMSQDSKTHMSDIARDILEPSIERRYKKFQAIKKKKSDTIMNAFSD